jgi:hypothetical protein
MQLILNLLWFVLGGFLVAIGYTLGAILLCLTIIGIPFGIQCFKLAVLALAPFGREIREREPPGGALAVIMNIIWIILPELELARDTAEAGRRHRDVAHARLRLLDRAHEDGAAGGGRAHREDDRQGRREARP